MARALQPALTRSRAWALGSQARTPLQDVRLSRSGSTIADTGSDALGDVDAGGTAYVYTLHNDGADALTVASVATGTLSNVTSATVSGITTPVVVAPGGSTTFTVTVTPAAAGACSYTLTVTSDDPDAEAVYTVSVSGTGVEAEINVLNPAAGSVADAGSYAADGGTEGVAAVQTWTIQNTGTAALTSVSVALANKVNCTATVTDSPATSIAASGSDTFDVTVTPTAAGAWSFDIDITSSDANEGNYDIGVSGTAASAYALTHSGSFDGTDERCVGGDRWNPAYTDKIGISLWFKPAINNAFKTPFSFFDTSGKGFSVQLTSTATMGLWVAGTGAIIQRTSTTFSTWAWHHLWIEYSGSGAASGVTIYYDGSAASLAAAAQDNLTALSVGTGQLCVGATLGASASQHFNGAISQVAVVVTSGALPALSTVAPGGSPGDPSGWADWYVDFSRSGDDMTGATGNINDGIGAFDLLPTNTEAGDRTTDIPT